MGFESQAAGQEAGRAGQLKGQLRLQWIMYAAGILAIGFGLFYPLAVDYRGLQDLVGSRLQNQAQVIEKLIAFQLDTVDDTMKFVEKQWAARGEDPERFNTFLEGIDIATAGARTLLVLDAEGTVRSSNRRDLVGLNFKDRDYFKAARDNPDPLKVNILPPFKTVYGYYVMPLSRKMVAPSGEFLGVVSVSLDTEFFRTIMGSQLYAKDMWSTVSHSDGTLFAMTPDRKEGAVGVNIAAPGSLIERHKLSGAEESLMTGTVQLTGEKRIVAVRNIRPARSASDNHLVAAVTREWGVIYSRWERDLFLHLGLFSFISLFSFAGLYLYQRKQRNSADAIAAAQKALLTATVELRLFFEMSSDLLGIADEDGRFRQINKAWEETLGYSSGEVVGLRFADFVHPEEGDGPSGTEEGTPEGSVIYDRVSRVRTKAGDYLWLEWRSTVVSEGLTFLIARDVTSRRASEAEREDLITELRGALAEVKVLSGLLPICASCKKIRDDQGYWNHLEKYIGERSGATFTHGICPDCLARLYPEYGGESDNKE